MGHVSRADLTKAPVEVAARFDKVAAKYDITNDVLALGRTRAWRKAVVAAVDPKPGQRILDLAAGTGTSSVPFAEAGATVVPTDFSIGMLEVGRERQPGPRTSAPARTPPARTAPARREDRSGTAPGR